MVPGVDAVQFYVERCKQCGHFVVDGTYGFYGNVALTHSGLVGDNNKRVPGFLQACQGFSHAVYKAEGFWAGAVGGLGVDVSVPVQKNGFLTRTARIVQVDFGLNDFIFRNFVDSEGVWRLTEGGRGAKKDVAFLEEGFSPVIVAIEYKAHAGVGQQGGFQAFCFPVGVRVSLVAFGGNEVVLEVDLRPGVVVCKGGKKPFALGSETLGEMVFHFVVEEEQDPMVCYAEVMRKVTEDAVERFGMVVVAVEERNRAGKWLEEFSNQMEIFFTQSE